MSFEIRLQIILIALAAYNVFTLLWWELIECRLIPEVAQWRRDRREAELSRM